MNAGIPAVTPETRVTTSTDQRFDVLDHGFVRVVDCMGDDSAIVQAARVSYGKGTRHVREDRALIRYLMCHRHTTPFEMCELKLHIKAPIFVARQWLRHRTASVNEYSARYSRLDCEYYVPDAEALAAQSQTNRQGREGPLREDKAQDVQWLIDASSEGVHRLYQGLLDEHGVARELARMVLPVNFYTQFYWKIDLHNLLHFLSLRTHPHAQHEIRAYADVILNDIVANWVPLTHEAFRDYWLNAVSLSGPALDVLRRKLAGEKVGRLDSGLSRREWDDLMQTLGCDAT